MKAEPRLGTHWWLPPIAITMALAVVLCCKSLVRLLSGTLGSDFFSYFTGAVQFQRHAFYDSPSFLDTMREYVAVSPATATLEPRFVQPPHIALLFEPLTAIALPGCYYLYALIVVIAIIAGSLLFFESWTPRTRIAASLMMPVAWWGQSAVFSGDDAWLVYLGAACIWYGRARSKPGLMAAGACLVLIKPQIGIWLLLLVLADGTFRRRRKDGWLMPALLAAWVVAPVLLTGDAGLYVKFAGALSGYPHGAQADQPNVRGLLEPVLGETPAAAIALLAAAAGIALVWQLLHCRRNGSDWRARWLAAIAISLLATPFDHSSEFWLLLPLSLVVLFPAGPTCWVPPRATRLAWWYWLLGPGLFFVVPGSNLLRSIYFAGFAIAALITGLQSLHRRSIPFRRACAS